MRTLSQNSHFLLQFRCMSHWFGSSSNIGGLRAIFIPSLDLSLQPACLNSQGLYHVQRVTNMKASRSIHRLLLLQGSKYPAGLAKPNVWPFHAYISIRTACATDDATICHSTSTLRSREGPSKAYPWVSFILANIMVEIPWGFICATLLYFTWYYPIGLFRNAEPTDTVNERGALV